MDGMKAFLFVRDLVCVVAAGALIGSVIHAVFVAAPPPTTKSTVPANVITIGKVQEVPGRDCVNVDLHLTAPVANGEYTLEVDGVKIDVWPDPSCGLDTMTNRLQCQISSANGMTPERLRNLLKKRPHLFRRR